MLNIKYSTSLCALAFALLAQGAMASPQDDLRKAVELDRAWAVEQLVKKGVDPNLTDAKGDPLLVIALREKQLDVAKALINAKDIDFDKTNKVGETPLMMAALNGLMPIVKLLVDDKEVEINKTGWTPLHYAASMGRDEVVKYLVDHAAYIDAESPNGTTPLMMAVRGGHITTVKLLLDEGADMRLKNQQNMTAIDFAKRYDKQEILDGLMARMQKLYPQQGK
jgi:ankyrin repeat protein